MIKKHYTITTDEQGRININHEPMCGYDHSYLVDGVCPKCGRDFSERIQKSIDHNQQIDNTKIIN